MKKRSRIVFAAALLFLFLLGPALVWAGGYNADGNGVAIKGYDAVAYFEQGQAVRGTSENHYEWSGVQWYFANSTDREKFVSNPNKYAPQYGGYCAFAVSRGAKADIDPSAWTIVEGKLYLNLNASVKSLWERDRDENIKSADSNWKGM